MNTISCLAPPPPTPQLSRFDDEVGACLRPDRGELGPTGDPAESLAPQESGELTERGLESRRMKGSRGAVCDAAYSVFLGFRGVPTGQFLAPTGYLRSQFRVVETGFEDTVEGDFAVIRSNQ